MKKVIELLKKIFCKDKNNKLNSYDINNNMKDKIGIKDENINMNLETTSKFFDKLKSSVNHPKKIEAEVRENVQTGSGFQDKLSF